VSPAKQAIYSPTAHHAMLTQVPRYVGNKIAVFSLQSLGCDVAALNTVQFSMFFRSHKLSPRHSVLPGALYSPILTQRSQVTIPDTDNGLARESRHKRLRTFTRV
jgi:hypothetical protein